MQVTTSNGTCRQSIGVLVVRDERKMNNTSLSQRAVVFPGSRRHGNASLTSAFNTRAISASALRAACGVSEATQSAGTHSA